MHRGHGRTAPSSKHAATVTQWHDNGKATCGAAGSSACLGDARRLRPSHGRGPAAGGRPFLAVTRRRRVRSAARAVWRPCPAVSLHIRVYLEKTPRRPVQCALISDCCCSRQASYLSVYPESGVNKLSRQTWAECLLQNGKWRLRQTVAEQIRPHLLLYVVVVTVGISMRIRETVRTNQRTYFVVISTWTNLLRPLLV
jgi:hypothetical protein